MNPRLDHSPSLSRMIGSIMQNRQLIASMILREVADRYRNSIFGLAWSFINPLVMLSVYAIFFSVVGARWTDPSGAWEHDFVFVLFAGLIIHALFCECLNRAPHLILANVNYVKKTIFPLEILPIVAVGTSLIHACISVGILLCGLLFFSGSISSTAYLFPLVLMPLLLTALGVSWFLASLGVYIRDIGHLTGMLTSVLLFLSPVFYPISALPDKYQIYMYLNPLAPAIEGARRTLIYGEAPNWTYWLIGIVGGGCVASIGYAWFQGTRKGFADVL